MSVRVFVDDDVERFESLQAFQRDATRDALRKFRAIAFRVTGNGLEVFISLVRKQFELQPDELDHDPPQPPSWLSRGLHIEASSKAPAHDLVAQASSRKRVAQVQAKVLMAARRGFAPDERVRSGTCPDGATAEADSIVERAQRRRQLFISFVPAVAVVGFVVGYPLSRSGPGGGSDLGTLVATGVGAVIGCLPWIALHFLRPSVEVSEITRAQRVARTAVTSVGPIVGGGLALAARLLGPP